MNPNILVCDSDSVTLLDAAMNPNDDWFEKFEIFDPAGRIRSGRVGDVAIISSQFATPSSRLLVFDLNESNFFLRFTSPHRREVLRRILRAALSSFTNNVSIPKSWAPFNHNSRISFHALPISAKRSYPEADARIEIYRTAFGSSNVFVYNCSRGWSDLSVSIPDRSAYDRGREAFVSFVTSAEAAKPAVLSPGAIQLSDDSFFHQENSIGFAEWYKAKLTVRQREFVDAPLTAPVRLRGAAGTGKTLALAVKLLVAAKQRLSEVRPTRFLFLTHSVATSEAITRLLSSLDNEGVIERLRSTPGFGLTIATLLDIAMDSVGSDLEIDGVLPLSADALEGRQLQLELIEAEIAAYIQSKDWSLQRATASDHFKSLMASQRGTPEFKRFAWEVMNEFACVLDAEGVHAKPSLRKQYLTGARQAWMMPLAKDSDREVVLSLYDRFNEQIRGMRAISVDQVISDYLNYLDSFRWNAVRGTRGFDVMFVDELHLFNRQERMVLHGLSRDASNSPGLFMAYDAKQAPSDTFMPSEARESSSSFWGRLNVGGIQKVELDQVFRYTPQIASFIRSLDQSFPALDLGDEWGEYSVASSVASAEVPSLTTLKDETELYGKIMERARQIKRKGGQKFSLAVLCCNQDRLSTFRNAGVHRKNFISIASREEAGAVKADAFRFVLSSPEYVAGLQFDCVFLLDVSKSEVPGGPFASSARRKFISTVYLGASRAKRHLELYVTGHDGGASHILDSAIESGSVSVVDWSGLPEIGDVAAIAPD